MQHWYWWVFGGLVSVLLVLDLCVFHRHARQESLRRSLLWSAFWVAIGLAFAALVWVVRGHDGAMAYLTAYLIEKSLSVDNLFVFLALFGYFAVAPANQHRVLFWGILGAIITRGLFIFGGVALLNHFHWLIYPLGAMLVFTGARLAFGGDTEVHPEKNPVIRFASRVLPFTREYHGEAFAVIGPPQGLRFTPLVLVLIAIETTDIVFAVDSVPAALAVSRDAVRGLHLEHLRHPRAARALLRPRRDDADAALPAPRPGDHPRAHRRQDDPRPLGGGADLGLAHGRGDDPRRRDRAVAAAAAGGRKADRGR